MSNNTFDLNITTPIKTYRWVECKSIECYDNIGKFIIYADHQSHLTLLMSNECMLHIIKKKTIIFTTTNGILIFDNKNNICDIVSETLQFKFT